MEDYLNDMKISIQSIAGLLGNREENAHRFSNATTSTTMDGRPSVIMFESAVLEEVNQFTYISPSPPAWGPIYQVCSPALVLMVTCSVSPVHRLMHGSSVSPVHRLMHGSSVSPVHAHARIICQSRTCSCTDL